MAEKFIISYPIFHQKYLSRKITFPATHFFYLSVYVQKNKYEVLRIILSGFYREKSLFQILEFSQIGQKSQKAGGYRKNFSV